MCILLFNGININLIAIWQLSLTTNGSCYLKKAAEVLPDRTDARILFLRVVFYLPLGDRSKDRAEEKPHILKWMKGNDNNPAQSRKRAALCVWHQDNSIFTVMEDFTPVWKSFKLQFFGPIPQCFQFPLNLFLLQSKVNPLFGVNKVFFVTAATQVRDGEDKAG